MDKKKKRFSFPKLNNKTLRQNVDSAIRNRRGHRPLSADREGGDTVIASYNVHKCVGLDKIFNPERIVNVISELNADIIGLQEIDKRFGERIGLLDLDYLNERTGLKPVPIQAMSSLGHGWHGNGLFFRNGEVRDVHQIKLPGLEPRGAVIVEFELIYGPLRVIGAHFGLLHRSRIQQAKTILSYLETRPDMPTLLIGDLNEWRIGKGSSLTSLSPLFDLAMGTLPSFPARFPVLALDRVFAYPKNLINSVEVHKSALARIASDHLPIKAHIDILGALNSMNVAANT
ncbi:endonuclease/exonuclease/phosphatase family protein [Bartonella sp. HY038]|uniref:endonuclease/exonuclease/phosphatase family protein n=1 Tax=Bartonella sp. HY038 TaxID=2759660 RepID=UPI0015FD968B|nr:endonuclease/exonuclease/phosphatase family protein [Bartonella sp. HY038]